MVLVVSQLREVVALEGPLRAPLGRLRLVAPLEELVLVMGRLVVVAVVAVHLVLLVLESVEALVVLVLQVLVVQLAAMLLALVVVQVVQAMAQLVIMALTGRLYMDQVAVEPAVLETQERIQSVALQVVMAQVEGEQLVVHQAKQVVQLGKASSFLPIPHSPQEAVFQ
jgi:hypothetical protein